MAVGKEGREVGSVRGPAVAGTFYPADPRALRSQVHRLLEEVEGEAAPPKAIVVPHAGYVYSGSVAASAYGLLRAGAGTIERVVLLGPAHRVSLRGLALPSAEEFVTPLGSVPVDGAAVRTLEALPQVTVSDSAHADEHSLEVQLPFLQEVLTKFSLVPLVVGTASPEQVEEALELLGDGPETLIVVSTDLSHYHEYGKACELDRATAALIKSLRYEEIRHDRACGREPLRGLLRLARSRGWRGETLDVRNSGDTAGPRDQVVGYGAFLFR
jgi:AmmeMemoRadiSam system protein B